MAKKMIRVEGMIGGEATVRDYGFDVTDDFTLEAAKAEAEALFDAEAATASKSGAPDATITKPDYVEPQK